MDGVGSGWVTWAVLGTSLLGERLSPVNWLGVVLIAVGAVAAAWK